MSSKKHRKKLKWKHQLLNFRKQWQKISLNNSNKFIAGIDPAMGKDTTVHFAWMSSGHELVPRHFHFIEYPPAPPIMWPEKYSERDHNHFNKLHEVLTTLRKDYSLTINSKPRSNDTTE